MASEEEIVTENTSEEKEEAVEVSETITDNELVEQNEGNDISGKMDDSSDEVIQEQNGNTEEIVDTEVAKSEDIVEQPSEPEKPPATSVDKEKGESEQKNESEDKKEIEKRRRGKRTGRGAIMKQLAVLNLPDGVILVKDRRYSGYHCTYCNCVLKSLATMKAHVGGKWHKRTLHMRMVNGKRRKVANSSKPASSSKSSGSPTQKVLPKEPLKSSLEEFLSTSKARIVGLSYIIETQRPNKEPTFQCNLCEVSCDSSDIKDHILGMKHCLMYSKLVKPVKLAELLAKQLTKAEKNKEIAKLSEELEKENGRGEITVKFLPAKSTTVRKPSNSQQRRRPGNRPFNRARSSGNKPAFRASDQRNRNSRATKGNAQKPPQKRRRDGRDSAKKRQMLERDFQDRMQYSMRGPQSNFFPGGWDMRNKTMDTFPYKRDASYYRDYRDFYDSYGERSFNRQYLNEPYEQMGQFNSREMYHREKYDGRQPFWSDQRGNYTSKSNKPLSYNNRSATSAHSEGYSRDSDAPISALKHLAGINVTSEEDAGVVINAINSLTNSVMNYKLRDLSQPVQQLLQKSLKKNDLTSMLDVPDKTSSGSASDRYGGSASDKYGGGASDRYGGGASDRYGGGASGRYGGSASDRYGGRSSQAYQDWGINQIAKPKNWLF